MRIIKEFEEKRDALIKKREEELDEILIRQLVAKIELYDQVIKKLQEYADDFGIICTLPKHVQDGIYCECALCHYYSSKADELPCKDCSLEDNQYYCNGKD